MYRKGAWERIYKLYTRAFSWMSAWKTATGELMGIVCRCGDTKNQKSQDWVKEETPLHKHEPSFSAAQQWWREQGPCRRQHPRVPRTPGTPWAQSMQPARSPGLVRPWACRLSSGWDGLRGPQPRRAAGSQTCHGRWFETQQMGCRVPEQSIAGEGPTGNSSPVFWQFW